MTNYSHNFRINNLFPKCKTCKYLALFISTSTSTSPSVFFCKNEQTSVAAVEEPERFFCSEHETPDGDKFVNFPK